MWFEKIFRMLGVAGHAGAHRFVALFPLMSLVLGGGCSFDGPKATLESAAHGWTHHGRDHNETRFDPASQINTENIDRLGLAWSLDIPNARSLPATPLVIDQTLYFTTDAGATVYAVSSTTGDVLWTHEHRFERPDNLRLSMGANRGVAYENGKIFVATADGYLKALDAETGASLWQADTFIDDLPRYISGAPRTFGGKVIIGHGGGDQGARGYVSTYDTETGALLWRFFTVPGNPADGFENPAMAMAAETWTGEWWKLGGGGAVWNGITYDQDLNQIYLGTGNGSPYDPAIRSPEGGDNLFLCSVVAVDADTGEYIWHYQINPREAWDYKAAMDMVLGDLVIDGEVRKVLMQAPTNGFFYVLDRVDGTLISAEKWGGKVTWASHIDLETGRPVETSESRYENGPVTIWPGHNGAHNFQSMSYSPKSGLAYIPHLEMGMIMGSVGEAFDAQQAMLPKYSFAKNSGAVLASYLDDSKNGGVGSLVAYDPVGQREVWRYVSDSYWNGGTMVTGGNLVFYGTALGEFFAFNSETGEQLWEFSTGLGIISSPISYSVDGVQYISLLVGYGTSAALGLPAYKHGWEFGRHPRRLLTFKLDGKASLPESVVPGYSASITVPGFAPKAELAELGFMVYHTACAGCHGVELSAESVAPDLKSSKVATDLEAFTAYVKQGSVQRGMPAYPEFSNGQLESVYHYIRATSLTPIDSQEAACDSCAVGL